jgi:hypothetical protein
MAVEEDLNEIVARAVTARVDAAVAQALSSDDVLGRYVTAALNQPVNVKVGYQDKKTTFLHHTITKALQGAVTDAVKRLIVTEAENLERLVGAELRKQREGIAKQLVGSLLNAADQAYGIKVDLVYPRSND